MVALVVTVNSYTSSNCLPLEREIASKMLEITLTPTLSRRTGRGGKQAEARTTTTRDAVTVNSCHQYTRETWGPCEEVMELLRLLKCPIRWMPIGFT